MGTPLAATPPPFFTLRPLTDSVSARDRPCVGAGVGLGDVLLCPVCRVVQYGRFDDTGWLGFGLC